MNWVSMDGTVGLDLHLSRWIVAIASYSSSFLYFFVLRMLSGKHVNKYENFTECFLNEVKSSKAVVHCSCTTPYSRFLHSQRKSPVESLLITLMNHIRCLFSIKMKHEQPDKYRSFGTSRGGPRADSNRLSWPTAKSHSWRQMSKWLVITHFRHLRVDWKW